jgi:hypothetical protein
MQVEWGVADLADFRVGRGFFALPFLPFFAGSPAAEEAMWPIWPVLRLQGHFSRGVAGGDMLGRKRAYDAPLLWGIVVCARPSLKATGNPGARSGSSTTQKKPE